MNMIDNPAIEAEQGVLGACINSPDIIPDIFANLTSSDFISATHRDLFSAVSDLSQNNEPIDLVTIGQRIVDNGRSIQTGYLIDLIAQTKASSVTAHFYAGIVKKYSKQRSLVATCQHFMTIAEQSNDPDEVIAQMVSQLGMMEHDSGQLVHIKDCLKRTVEKIEERFKNGNQLDGLETGLNFLDQRWQGMKAGQLIIMAGRPSMGKSLVGVQIAAHAATKKLVLIFSLEMTADELMIREIASKGRVDMDSIKNPAKAGETFWPKLSTGVTKVKDLDLMIDDTSGLFVNQICARARAQHRKTPVGLIVIDHIHIIATDGKQSREREMAGISLKLKALAKELQCPVLAVAQLNRNVEQKQDKRPSMSDLRDSGSIEQDADIVSLIYRDDYYSEDSQFKGTVEIITAKNRGGQVGTDRFAVNLAQSRVENLAPGYIEPEQPIKKKWSTQ